MAIEIIDVGSSPNDGQGDPIRTAYIKCNNNFVELSTRQQNPPANLNGNVGDVAGMYAFDENFWYYCFQDYGNGNVAIWQQISSESPSLLSVGNSNVIVSNTAINIGVDASANVAQFLANGAIFSNLIVSGISEFTGNVTSAHILPSGNLQYDLGAPDAQWRSLYLSGNTIYLGTAEISANATAVTLTSGSGASFTVSGNSSSGNLSADNVSANVVVANAFVGDGSALTNVTAFANVAVTQIANGTSVLGLSSINGNITAAIAGVANVMVLSPGGISTSQSLTVANAVSVSGNTVLNALSAGNVSASGTAQISGALTAASVSTVGITASGNASVTGHITAASITTTGNITGGNVSTTGLMQTKDINGTGNIDMAGYITTGGLMTASSANVTDTTDAASTVTGALRVRGGIGVGGTVYSTHLVVTGTSNIGSLSANSITSGTLSSARLSGSYTGITAIGTLTSLTVSGNVSGNNFLGNISAANVVGSVSSATTAGTVTNNAQANITSVGTLTSLSVTGNITGGNLITSGFASVSNITKTGANGVGNIGSSTSVFNTVFAKATSAQYADLAEKYRADADYEFGTVVCFGGSQEVTASTDFADHRVAGVISQNPSYIMNSGLESQYVAMVALQGRVYCKVNGPVSKGDLLVSSTDGRAGVCNQAPAGTIIGKSLEDFADDVGVIEISVGRP